MWHLLSRQHEGKWDAMDFMSSARNITGGLIYILQTFCSTNFLPVFLRRNKLTIRWIFNKNQEKSPSTFLTRILDTSDMLYQHISTDKLRLQLSTVNVNIKMASKARMIKEGEKEERATVKANILTIFLFNEAHGESTIQFFSSSKSPTYPLSLLLPSPRQQKYAYCYRADSEFHCNNKTARNFPFFMYILQQVVRIGTTWL